MKKTLLLAIFCLFTGIPSVFSQSEIPVDLYTGTPSITIPLASITSQDIGEDVFLSYNAKGVSVKAPNGFYGIGWNLQAGGRVTREVRGLPDDYNTTTRHGWLHSQANVSVGALGNTSDLSNSTCSDEQADYNAIHAWNYQIDPEPDLFHYSIPGHSGSFVFDNSATPFIKLIPFNDVRIQPVFDASNTIIAFTLTTNNGNVYSFTATASETTQSFISPTVSQIEFVKTDYELYKNLTSYNHEWALTQVTSPSGAFLKYTYTTVGHTFKRDYQPDHTIQVWLKNNTAQGYTGRRLFSREVSAGYKKIQTIESSALQKIEFVYADETNSDQVEKMLVGVKIYDNRRIPDKRLVKELAFEYSAVSCTINCTSPDPEEIGGYVDYSGYKRQFLSSITQVAGCDQLLLYSFGYKDSNLLPLPNSLSMDFWGYFNGKSNLNRVPAVYVYPQLPASERYRVFPIANYSGEQYVMEGADLTTNPNTVGAGVLNQISYASGAKTTLVYEPSQFYDAVANQTYYGGGLRIRSIVTEDGVNPGGTIVRNFEYKDASGRSSGKILYKPSYVVPLYRYVDPSLNGTYTADYNALIQAGKNPWIYLVGRVDVDLARSSNTAAGVVSYEKVTARTPGTGYSRFEYQMPAAWGNGSSGEWAPSVTRFARSAACPAMDFITSGGPWIFPYTPNPEYDYANGRLVKKYEYSEQNVLVRETSLTYQDIFLNGAASDKVWGVNYHKMPNTSDVYFFSKYFLLSSSAKVTAIENVITYDAANSNKFATESLQYFHESPHHRLLTKTKRTESDGAVYQTYLKYPLDYGTVPAGADKPSEMIGKLQTSYRNGIPVEQYSSVTRNGQPEKFTGGSIIKFNDFGGTSILPEYQLQLTGVPLSAYVPSSINPVTNVFDVDPHYNVIATTLAYTSFEKALSAIGESRTPVSTSWGYDYSLPVAEITNAASDQFAFSDFETTSSNEFTIANGVPTMNLGRTGTYGVYADTKLSRTIAKGGDRYVLSGWIKRTNVSVALTLIIKNISGITDHQQTHTLDAGTGYKYFEFEVPINPSLTQFMVEVQGAFATTATKPALDDVSFYPAQATLTSYAYAIPFGVSAVTQRDQTTYKTYDTFGRTKDILDKDKNLVRHYDYFITGQTSTAELDPLFAGPKPAYINQPALYHANKSCIEGITYEWDFGSGFLPGERVQSHTFTTSGEKVVTLRVSHPYYGVKTHSRTINVEFGIAPD